MSNYARIVDDQAVDVSATPETSFHSTLAALFAPVPDFVRPGWTIVNGFWTAPAPAPDAPSIEDRRVTRLAFLKRFTAEERAAITAAQATDIVVDGVMLLVMVSEYIDLNGEDAKQGLQVLAAKGYLEENRPAEILEAPVQPAERPSNWTPQA